MRRPDWWCYLERCSNGHEWGPGLITVSCGLCAFTPGCRPVVNVEYWLLASFEVVLKAWQRGFRTGCHCSFCQLSPVLSVGAACAEQML